MSLPSCLVLFIYLVLLYIYDFREMVDEGLSFDEVFEETNHSNKKNWQPQIIFFNLNIIIIIIKIVY